MIWDFDVRQRPTCADASGRISGNLANPFARRIVGKVVTAKGIFRCDRHAGKWFGRRNSGQRIELTIAENSQPFAHFAHGCFNQQGLTGQRSRFVRRAVNQKLATRLGQTGIERLLAECQLDQRPNGRQWLGTILLL